MLFNAEIDYDTQEAKDLFQTTELEQIRQADSYNVQYKVLEFSIGLFPS